MQTIRILANAKLNLSLDIVGKRQDAYHEMEMVMHSVSLCDEVTITKTSNGKVEVWFDNEMVPSSEETTIHKAAKVFFASQRMPCMGLKIKVKKNIPSQAGLGGASADAAAVLLGLDKLYSAKLTWKQIWRFGRAGGGGCALLPVGGAAVVRGIGEQIRSLPSLIEGVFVIAKPQTGVCTKEAFARFDEAQIHTRPNTEQVMQAVANSDLPLLGRLCTNVFEQVCADDMTQHIKETMLLHGAFGAQMTGSGSAVFGLFAQAEQGRRLCEGAFKASADRNGLRSAPGEGGNSFLPR